MEFMRYSPWLGTELRKDPVNGKFMTVEQHQEILNDTNQVLVSTTNDLQAARAEVIKTKASLDAMTTRTEEAEAKLASAAAELNADAEVAAA